jgi:hypothetical protein
VRNSCWLFLHFQVNVFPIIKELLVTHRVSLLLLLVVVEHVFVGSHWNAFPCNFFDRLLLESGLGLFNWLLFFLLICYVFMGVLFFKQSQLLL